MQRAPTLTMCLTWAMLWAMAAQGHSDPRCDHAGPRVDCGECPATRQTAVHMMLMAIAIQQGRLCRTRWPPPTSTAGAPTPPCRTRPLLPRRLCGHEPAGLRGARLLLAHSRVPGGAPRRSALVLPAQRGQQRVSRRHSGRQGCVPSRRHSGATGRNAAMPLAAACSPGRQTDSRAGPLLRLSCMTLSCCRWRCRRQRARHTGEARQHPARAGRRH